METFEFKVPESGVTVVFHVISPANLAKDEDKVLKTVFESKGDVYAGIWPLPAVSKGVIESVKGDLSEKSWLETSIFGFDEAAVVADAARASEDAIGCVLTEEDERMLGVSGKELSVGSLLKMGRSLMVRGQLTPGTIVWGCLGSTRASLLCMGASEMGVGRLAFRAAAANGKSVVVLDRGALSRREAFESMVNQTRKMPSVGMWPWHVSMAHEFYAAGHSVAGSPWARTLAQLATEGSGERIGREYQRYIAMSHLPGAMEALDTIEKEKHGTLDESSPKSKRDALYESKKRALISGSLLGPIGVAGGVEKREGARAELWADRAPRLGGKGATAAQQFADACADELVAGLTRDGRAVLGNEGAEFWRDRETGLVATCTLLSTANNLKKSSGTIIAIVDPTTFREIKYWWPLSKALKRELLQNQNSQSPLQKLLSWTDVVRPPSNTVSTAISLALNHHPKTKKISPPPPSKAPAISYLLSRDPVSQPGSSLLRAIQNLEKSPPISLIPSQDILAFSLQAAPLLRSGVMNAPLPKPDFVAAELKAKRDEVTLRTLERRAFRDTVLTSTGIAAIPVAIGAFTTWALKTTKRPHPIPLGAAFGASIFLAGVAGIHKTGTSIKNEILSLQLARTHKKTNLINQ